MRLTTETPNSLIATKRGIAHLHDDVTRAVYYRFSGKELLKMASGSSEAGGFTCCVPGCYNNSKKHKGKFSFIFIISQVTKTGVYTRVLGRKGIVYILGCHLQ